MNKLLFFFAAIILLYSCGASKNSTKVEEAKTAASESLDLSKYSLNAKSLISDLGGQNPTELSGDFVKKYAIIEKDNGQFIRTSLKVNDQISEKELNDRGVEVQSKSGKVWSALTPVNKFVELQKVKGVEHIDLSPKSNLK